MTTFRAAQDRAWANKLDKRFNVTDVPLEFCLLSGEVAEAFSAWRKDTGHLARNWPTWRSSCSVSPR